MNDFAFNPAVAGSQGQTLVAKVGYRKQWAGGFGGEEPSTFLVSGHSSVNPSRSVGLGLMIYNDVTGPTKRTGVNVAYAYHLPINSGDQHLSFGLSGTILNYGIDFNALQLTESGDAAAMSNIDSKTTGDANFGAYFYGDGFYAGLAFAQLIGSKLEISDNSTNTGTETVQLSRHIFLSGGYKYDINEDFAIEPSIFLRTVPSVSSQVDLNARFIYQDQYWAGLTYRTSDAIAIMLGLALDSGINLAYSYDITTSNLNSVSNGSHEITIGYNYGWGTSNAAPAAY